MSRINPRSYALGPLRFPCETTEGETVTIVRQDASPGRTILTAEDGRRFERPKHGHKIVPVPDEEE